MAKLVYDKTGRLLFTKEMKEEYTILCPMMLRIHFELFVSIFRHYGYKAECAASLLLFIYAVSKYYYDLNLSLLTKSITLFFIGIACIAAWYFFTQKRTRHEKV